MAAATSSRASILTVAVYLFLLAVAGVAGYGALHVNWEYVLTGPGRNSRILLLVFVLFNWKALPFAWTYRVFHAFIYHTILYKSPNLTPQALFKPIITGMHAPLMEIDYNLHKSNSTFFTDLDVSRIHLLSYLFRPAVKVLSNNAKTGLVRDPKTDKPINGAMGVMLGSVACSFKREIGAYKGYQLWSRVLTWDRKWLYIVTHFVPKGAAKPTESLDQHAGKAGGVKGVSDTLAKKVYATAVSKYVFKVGRLTVHPAIIMEASNLLPVRPGGWKSGENQLGDENIDIGDIDLSQKCGIVWDWRRVEAQRRHGMDMVAQAQTIDEMHHMFDGGDSGVLADVGNC
ncbi:hypothetical protein QQS21_002498 [Conoideocrella luteorostrata]|uniref:Capsule polysaccharide biosynthesis protein n=1 Tax=Conoideocrella luteorostrata TaxID=1105319 RepID=A0AAJ0CZ37_9HYPO|nr:hypothetical protein QQS21_002498 [Conoideocrella luteorostrata]